jgi:integrase
LILPNQPDEERSMPSVPAKSAGGWQEPAPGDWDYRSVGPIAFDRFIAELLKLYDFPLRSKATRDKLRYTLEILAGLLGPDGTTAGLSIDLVASFVKSRPPGESPHTTHGLLANVRSACNFAVSQGYLRTSPFSYRKRWIRLSAPTRKKHHSQDEIRRVLDLLATEVRDTTGWARWRARRLQALASTVAYTGLRRDEALHLHGADVDLPGRMILLVERSKLLKTEMSSQPVPICLALVPILESWMGHCRDIPEASIDSPPDCPYLFPGVTRVGAWTGGPPGSRPLDQLKAAGERAGVQEFTFQSLRHSWATHAESWGMSDVMIQRVLRHTTTRTQLRYRHPDLDNMRLAVDRIDFSPTPPTAPEPGPEAEHGSC